MVTNRLNPLNESSEVLSEKIQMIRDYCKSEIDGIDSKMNAKKRIAYDAVEILEANKRAYNNVIAEIDRIVSTDFINDEQ